MSHSGNVEEKKWYPCDENELRLPEEAQEGSVLIISQTELATLLASFNNEEFDLLPTAEIEPQMWKYQTSSSASTNTAWTLPSYDDRNWQEGLSGFGANNPPGSFVSTTWTSFDIRLRYHLDLTDFTPEQMSALSARIHHDEDVTVWFNGVEAFQESGYLTAYKSMPINQEALDALTPDANNIIAIECTNRGGGAYIDFGLSGIRPIPTGIETIRIEENKIIGNGGIYDLQGRKVTSLQKGVYIKDGKKIITANP